MRKRLIDYPDIVKQWNYKKNIGININVISYGSSKSVWWICEKGHEWEAPVKKRTGRGDGCPYCTGKRPIKGVNDLATIFPHLILEWDFSINDKLPEEYLSRSNARVGWICSKGHKWKAMINDRARGRGCPYCSGKRVIVGETDLKSKQPDVAGMWDYEKNGTIKPSDVSCGSNKIVYWKCNKGHTWKEMIKYRVYTKHCPYCEGTKLVVGENDLATLYPELVKEWSEKNERKCSEYFPQSNESVWWRCEKGHEWKYLIYSRIRGHKCPYCSGKKPIIGETDLATIEPELCLEWDYKKNRNRKPESFLPKSNDKVWWKCKEGHSWRACIYHRTNGTGCPYCLS